MEAAANVLCPAMVVYISRIFSVLAVYSLQENSRHYTEWRVAKHGENALCRFAKTRIPEAQLKEENLSRKQSKIILIFYDLAVAQENEHLHIMRRSLELSGVGTLN